MLPWKVRGLCEDLSNVDTLFDTVRVYGDMMGSNIHHMWYGMYSYGHLGGVWNDNLMHGTLMRISLYALASSMNCVLSILVHERDE